MCGLTLMIFLICHITLNPPKQDFFFSTEFFLRHYFPLYGIFICSYLLFIHLRKVFLLVNYLYTGILILYCMKLIQNKNFQKYDALLLLASLGRDETQRQTSSLLQSGPIKLVELTKSTMSRLQECPCDNL